MEISELKKYIDFELKKKPHLIENYETLGSQHRHLIVSFDQPTKYTYMVGHQPRALTDKEIEANKLKNPNVITSIDADDPYWCDDVGDPLGVDYDKLQHIDSKGTDLYKAQIKIGDKSFDILIENDCGFAVGYGPAEIYELITDTVES